MPTRVLLEGPAIEPLLAQVREEYGADVRIISADKVRSGGFGGFFAKQHYELSVEVPDPPQQRPDVQQTRPAVQAAPHTLEELLARAEAHDDMSGRTGDAPRAKHRRDSREADVSDTETAVQPDGDALTTHAFADLLAGLDSADTIAGASAAARRPPPGPAGPVERHEHVDDDVPAGTALPFHPPTAVGSPVNTKGSGRPLPPVPSLAELVDGLDLGATDAPTGPAPSVPTRSAADAYALPIPPALTSTPARRVSPLPHAVAPNGALPNGALPNGVLPNGVLANGALTGEATSVVHRASPVPPDIVAQWFEGTPEVAYPVVANLIRLGMPVELAAAVSGPDTYSGVLTALAGTPAPPDIPDRPGEILVLLGELPAALTGARHCLQQIGADQSHLLLCGASAAGTGVHSSKVIKGPEDAARRVDKLHAADAAWVVAMNAPIGATDAAWVDATCAALRATAVWAVVDATRKTADTARHIEALGDIEALVVHGLDHTGDPGTVLGLDLPIVSLDGRPATPHAWAAMLCARIATDAPQAPAVARRLPRGS